MTDIPPSSPDYIKQLYQATQKDTNKAKESADSKSEISTNIAATKSTFESTIKINSNSSTPKGISFADKVKDKPAEITEGPGANKNTVNTLKSLPGLEKAWDGTIDSNVHKGTTSETAILVPKGLDYSKEVKVMYYFHGWDGNISSTAEVSKNELMEYGKKHNTVIVMPQGPARDDGIAKDSWMADKGQFVKFNQDVLAKIDSLLPPEAKVTTVEIAGHSAGGVALRNCLVGMENGDLSGGRWKTVKLDKVHFLDATYSDANDQNSSDRAEAAYAALKKINPSAEFNITYLKWSMTDKGYSYNNFKSPLVATDTLFHQITPDQAATRVHATVPKLFFGEYSEK